MVLHLKPHPFCCCLFSAIFQEHCALPDYVEFVPQQPVDLSAVLSAASPDAMDLLLQLLVLRPDKRIGAAEALRHPYFTKYQPSPCDPSELALPIPEERKNKVSYCSYRKEDAFLEVQPE